MNFFDKIKREWKRVWHDLEDKIQEWIDKLWDKDDDEPGGEWADPSKPSGTDGMGYACQHPCSVSEAKSMKGPGWIMSDCGRIIRELNGGGGLPAGECNYSITYRCARDLRKLGRSFIYFDVNTTRHNYSTIALQALKDANL